jgi:pyruvate,orthophosphate dikinase
VTREEAIRRVLPLLADPPRTSVSAASRPRPLITGLGASPGTVTGPIATAAEAATASADAGRPAILVRPETSPDDVHGMARAAGLLTARGGLASHAAVVARGWGIPAVVGASDLEVRDGEVALGERVLPAGDVITIDGTTGEVFEGAVPAATEIAPEARTLLAWADELGISVAPAGPDAAVVAGLASARAVAPEACLRAIAIKGFAPLQNLADALLATPDEVQPVVDALAADGLVATTAGAYRLSDAGAARAAAALEAERSAWGADGPIAALDAFLALDARMKELVTAWQLRDPAAQVLNDHSDADYDRRVLDGLADLHADAVAWLEPLTDSCPRLGGYAVRLRRALEAAGAGDRRFVASPRVDSYHGIWFELHEDLIQLAGRTRAEETAAGRA